MNNTIHCMDIYIKNLEIRKAIILQRIQNSKDKYLKHQIQMCQIQTQDMNDFLVEQKELEIDFQETTKLVEELKENKEVTKE